MVAKKTLGHPRATMCSASNKGRLGRAGFSLIELLAVLGIIGLMAVAGLPALKGITGSSGRTGGINALMSALDQTRSAAILSGVNAYLIFPDATFRPGAGLDPLNYIYRSYAIFRDVNADLEETNTTTAQVQLGKWESLPQGITLVSASVAALPVMNLDLSLPGTSATTSVSVRAIGFNPSGGLLDAAATNGVTVYEGRWDGSQGLPARPNRIVDQITLNRFTGRANLSMATNNGAY